MLENFEENNCRICSKRFCCKECRMKHENNKHDVHANCDICFYGKAYIIEPSTDLIEHIQNTHLPLHCINCQKLFTTTEQLLQHNKCDNAPKNESLSEKVNVKTPRTPVTPLNVDESSPKITPIYENIICSNQQYLGISIKSVFTSTPMQKIDNKILGDNLQTESATNIEIKSFLKSSIKTPSTINDSKKSDRKVTFSETPTFEYLQKQPNIYCQNGNNLTDTSDGKFYSATQIQSEILLEEKENINNQILYCNNGLDSEDTVWVSAVSGSSWAISNNNIDNKITKFNFGNGSDTPVLNIVNDNKTNNCNKLWTSVTSLVKSVIGGLSMSTPNNSSKRTRPDYDSDFHELPVVKRRKFVDIKCRRPIRKLNPLLINYGFKEQSTQTNQIENPHLKLLINSSTQTD